MKKEFVVKSREKDYRLEILFHKSNKVGDQQIEPEFYLKYSSAHKTHDGVHYEMEVLHTGLEGLEFFSKIHIHSSLKNNKKYVCWTGHVPTKSMALLITRMWCAGSIYTIEKGEDFGCLFERHGLDAMSLEKMIKTLEEEYNILVSE